MLQLRPLIAPPQCAIIIAIMIIVRRSGYNFSWILIRCKTTFDIIIITIDIAVIARKCGYNISFLLPNAHCALHNHHLPHMAAKFQSCANLQCWSV